MRRSKADLQRRIPKGGGSKSRYWWAGVTRGLAPLFGRTHRPDRWLRGGPRVQAHYDGAFDSVQTEPVDCAAQHLELDTKAKTFATTVGGIFGETFHQVAAI